MFPGEDATLLDNIGDSNLWAAFIEKAVALYCYQRALGLQRPLNPRPQLGDGFLYPVLDYRSLAWGLQSLVGGIVWEFTLDGATDGLVEDFIWNQLLLAKVCACTLTRTRIRAHERRHTHAHIHTDTHTVGLSMLLLCALRRATIP